MAYPQLSFPLHRPADTAFIFPHAHIKFPMQLNFYLPVGSDGLSKFFCQGKIMKARTPQGFAIGIRYSFLPVFASALSPL